MIPGHEQIANERARQISGEGWSAEHDDKHINGVLVKAATCYEVNAAVQMDAIDFQNPKWFDENWPWDIQWWKPSTPARDLVKAGALYMAEMDRIQRQMKLYEPGDNNRIAYSMIVMERLKTELAEVESCVDRCAQKLDLMHLSAWRRFKRWLRGGYEYGHTGNPGHETIYRRCVRTGGVSMWAPLRWVEIHHDHWHKFVAVRRAVHRIVCPKCKGSRLIICCSKCADTRKVLTWEGAK